MGSLNDALLKSGQERRAREAAKKAAQPQSPPTQKRGFLQTERAASMQQYEAEQRASNAARARGAAMPVSPTKSAPPTAPPTKSKLLPSEGRYHTRGMNSPFYDPASDMTGRTASSRPAELPKAARGKPGYDATVKPKPSRPAPGRPPGMPASRKSPEAAAKQVVADGAALRAPAQKAPPKATTKKSWWDKFSDDHQLSANKSYADYRKLMGD